MKRYENEIAVLLLLFVAVGAYFFQASKHTHVQTQRKQALKVLHTLEETAALKRLWGDTATIKRKLASLRQTVSSEKTKWRQSGTKVDVAYTSLSGSELDRVLSKWFAVPLRIESLRIAKETEGYRMEIVSRW